MFNERILGREEDIFSSTLAFWLFLRDTSPRGSQASDWISRDRRFRDMVGDMCGDRNPPEQRGFLYPVWFGTQRAGQGKGSMVKAQETHLRM